MRPSICVIQHGLEQTTETFLRAQTARLPGNVTVVHHSDHGLPSIGSRTVLSQSVLNRALRTLQRKIARRGQDWEIKEAYLKALRDSRAQVVIAQFGVLGVQVMDACEMAGIPLIVYFRGYDASRYSILARYERCYRLLFERAFSIFAVSSSIKRRLVEMGADPSKVICNPSGVDCSMFTAASPAMNDVVFLAVGRFVEKKAPYLTIMAFRKVLDDFPGARLRMIGDGVLLGTCRDLARALGMEHTIDFVGAQPHERVAAEMQRARAFVQHSIQATDGDCEGTPNAILEAGASGLPVVATNHAGIVDVVLDEVTGFLVNEKDVSAMAARMLRLAREPDLAGQLGAAARRRIANEFTIEICMDRLCQTLQHAVNYSNNPNGRWNGTRMKVLNCNTLYQ